MASANVKGSASILWTPVGGSELTHLLAVPLGIVKEMVPSRAWGERHDWFAANKRNRRIVTVAPTAVHEMVWVNRLDNDPIGWLDFLEQSLLYDLESIYLPYEGSPEYPFRVIEVIGSSPDMVTLPQDRDRFGGGEWESTFRVRRTDGGSFAGIVGV